MSANPRRMAAIASCFSSSLAFLNFPEIENLGWREASSAVGELLVQKNTKGVDVVYAIGRHL
jgi:hypothetical protein